LSVKQPFEERPAPTAPRAGAVALGQLRDTPRPLDADEVLDLPPGDVKAKTEIVVEFHRRVASKGLMDHFHFSSKTI
jgi:hypothetical protein